MIAAETRFYITGGTLPPDALSYVERQADRDLLDALRASEYCYVLNSRQMGKSSLCVRAISRLREEGTRTVFLDLTKFGGRNLTAEQWYAALLAELGRELGLRAECLQYWKEHPELPPVQRLFGAITEVALDKGVQVFRSSGVQEGPDPTRQPPATPMPEHLNTRTPEHPRPLVIFIDEIDVTRSLPFNTDEFFAAIRQCYVGRATEPLLKQVTFCLLGTATPAELIEDTRISPFNIGRRIEVRDFTPEEAAPLAEGLVGVQAGSTHFVGTRSGVQEKTDPSETSDPSDPSDLSARTPERLNAERLLQRILYWTGGHPYLTQRLCRAVAEARSVTPSPPHPLTPSVAVDRLCEALFLTHTAKEGDDNLALVRNRLLRSEADLASLLELYGKLRAGKAIPDDETNPLCGILKLSGVATVEAGRLRVKNRIYERVFDREWVTQHMPDAELRRQKAAFRRGLVRASAVAGLIIAIMAGLALWALDQAQQARNATAHQRIAARRMELARDRAEKERLAAQRLLYLADMNVAYHDWETGNIGRMRELLDAHRPQPGEEDRRSFEWYYLWRLSHGDQLTLRAPTAPSRFVLFSPDGKRLATGTEDGTVTLWDLGAPPEGWSGRAVRALKGHTMHGDCARFSPDGQRLTMVSADGTVKFWDLITGRATRTLALQPMRGGVVVQAWFPTANTLATRNRSANGNAENTITFRDLPTGRVILTLKTGPFMGAAFSPDGKTLATGGLGGEAGVTLWDVRTGRKTRTFGPFRLGEIPSLAFSRDGRRLAAGSYPGVVKLWDLRTGREMRTLQAHSVTVWSVMFSPDGRRLATASRDGTARIWDVASGRETRIFKGHSGEVFLVAFSPDGRRLATVAGGDSVKVWDAATAPQMPPLGGAHVAFSPDGTTLTTGSKLWDLRTRRITRTLRAHGPAAFSPNGAVLATASGGGTVKLWDVAAGTHTRTLKAHTGGVDSVAFSPDGKALATGSGDGTVKLWEVAGGRALWTHRQRGNRPVAFSPDGQMLVTADNPDRPDPSPILFLDVATGRVVRSLPGNAPGWVSSLAFSPDGKMVAAGNWNQKVTLWDLATGRTVRILRCSNLVNTVVFSSDGRRLVSGSADGAVKLWDVETGREILTLRGPTLDTMVALSPDGRWLAAGSLSPVVMLWEAASKEEVAARDAQERATAARAAR